MHWIIGILIALILTALVISFVKIKIRKKYINFIKEHSACVKYLKELNEKYKFKIIPNFDMKHSYDNVTIYKAISPNDYLTYELVYKQKDINKALKDTLENKNNYAKYLEEINKCPINSYDIPTKLNVKKLNYYENKYIKNKIVDTQTEFCINVKLYLITDLRGYIARKSHTFTPREIKDIIFKLNQKEESYYRPYYKDKTIWASICKVERGKVTNKMRFAIYERDGYRCCKCHKYNVNLEIDHIIPISKGGKSTWDNLQTLCHECNIKKGADIDIDV